MDRHPRNTPAYRSVAGLEDARDLRAAITGALDATPIDERVLRDAIWTYVGTERDAGVSPGRVIFAITAMVESAVVAPGAGRAELLRSVILWCVEAYFGHLGGDVFGSDGAAAASPESQASTVTP
jgi:hypothetical protein